MESEKQICVYSLRALANYIIAAGARRVDDSPSVSHGEYDAHWTGSKWEDADKPNAWVWEYKKYADEYLNENRELLLEKLRGFNRGNKDSRPAL